MIRPHASDLWLSASLFLKMLTGLQVFTGETVSLSESIGPPTAGG